MNAPDWLPGEMPAGYQNRLAEIRRLSADLKEMDRCGRLLWEVGTPLAEAVRDAFVAMRYEADLIPDSDGLAVSVRLDAGRRLLLSVGAGNETIRRKGPELAAVFQMLHGASEDADRVVLVANSDPAARPADKSEGIGPDASSFLTRMGANFVTSTTVFRLWMLSLENRDRAREHVDRLHAQDGGAFAPTIT